MPMESDEEEEEKEMVRLDKEILEIIEDESK
jgi:hypothetical protein